MQKGSRYELDYHVTSEDLAKALSMTDEDDFPEVLATARMVALMELAAARLLRPMLQTQQLSVGVHVDIEHMAATPCSEDVKAVAEFVDMQGKLYLFNVELWDNGGLAGKGTHTRAVIDTERLEQGAKRRIQAGAN
ncbi:hypothetical protein KIH87_03565 [Paraneptunicella aestuarii]|uniref:thioesterase family protein n=1 Tax=Paraneptunicella aestuarii TaxID=2831148 RepID=UPI001E5E84A3|nr:hotdog domain-containing protein [Paraneptunicella aestuarii]UAA39447.1 hypothetical protein KIH87_03565 [Paraneptunicella aestuarii]